MVTPAGPHIDPVMLEVWQRGALETIPLGPLERSEAIALRHRLYRLRTTLRRIGHPDVKFANAATIALRHYENHSMVIVYPANKVIEEALLRAGITSSNPPPLE